MAFSLKHHLITLLVTMILGLIFYLLPEIDLYISRWFYNETQSFYLAHEPIVVFIHKAVPIIVAIFLTSIAIWIAFIFWRTRILALRPYLAALYLLTCAALGPGVMAHYVFKDYFQRARPTHSQEFGGTYQFTPAFTVGKECVHNCSFVSGHAAAGFMFYSLAFISTFAAYRRLIFVGATLLGSIFGLCRVIEGGHFLSDVVFAGFVVYLTCYYLAIFFAVKLKMGRA